MNSRFQMTPGSNAPDKADPAAANECWEFVRDVLAKLGLAVLVVESAVNPQKAGWPHVGALIGYELEATKLGLYDSGKLGDRARWYFHVAADRMPEAIAAVKRVLEAYGLLSQVKLGHADAEACVWRTISPGNAGKTS